MFSRTGYQERGEDDVGGDGSQVAEKSGAGLDFGPSFLPRLIGEVGNCVAGECQEIEDDEHRGKVVLPMVSSRCNQLPN